jgi:hypothetical protein
MTALLKALEGKSNESRIDSDLQNSTFCNVLASDKQQAEHGHAEKRDVSYYKTARLC